MKTIIWYAKQGALGLAMGGAIGFCLWILPEIF